RPVHRPGNDRWYGHLAHLPAAGVLNLSDSTLAEGTDKRSAHEVRINERLGEITPRSGADRAAVAGPAALPWPDRPRCRGRTGRAALARTGRAAVAGPAALPWPGPAALPWPGPAALPWPGPAALPWADLPTAALAVIAGSHATEWRHGS